MSIDLVGMAMVCGYLYAVCVDTFETQDKELEVAKERGVLSLIEVKCSIGALDDLGRSTTALEKQTGFHGVYRYQEELSHFPQKPAF